MANRSFVVSLNSLVNSFLIFQNKLWIERKVTEISNHDPLTPSIRETSKTQQAQQISIPAAQGFHQARLGERGDSHSAVIRRS